MSGNPVISQPVDASAAASISAPDWFAPNGEPKRFNSRVVPLVAGEEAFNAVADALKAAKYSIHMAFWGLDPGVILKKPKDFSVDSENVLANILLSKAAQGKRVNVLVWNSPSEAIGSGGSGGTKGDGVLKNNNSVNLGVFHEISKQVPNLTVKMTNAYSRITGIGSFHQKIIIVDIEDPAKATAFVMGHNMMPDYWSTTALLGRNRKRETYLRIKGFKASEQNKGQFEAEYDIKENWEKLGPLLDVSSQIWGAAVSDVYHTFGVIWEANGQTMYPTVESASARFQKNINEAPNDKTSTCQVARTWHRGGIHAIRELYQQSFKATNRYIVMVNQYLRDQNLARDIIADFRKRPGEGKKKLHLIIFSNSFEDSFIEKGFEKVVIAMFNKAGISVSLARLITKVGSRRRDIYIHAKVLMVDDVFTALGSANFNDRSMRSDPEVDIGVLDADLTSSLRIKLMNILIGDAMNSLQDDPESGVKEYLEKLQENDIAYKAGRNLPNGVAITYTPTKNMSGIIPHTLA